MKARFVIAVNEKNEWVVCGNDYEKNHPTYVEMKSQAIEFLDIDTKSKDINTYIVEVEIPARITLKGVVVNEDS